MQAIIPRVAQDGTPDVHFRPKNPKQTMAQHFQRAELTDLIQLTGTTSPSEASATFCVEGADAAALQPGGPSKVPVFELSKFREGGDWSLRYQWPLSLYQAFSMAIAILASPVASAPLASRPPLPPLAGPAATDRNGPAANDVYERSMAQMAAEAREALARPGKLAEAHEAHYKPYAQAQLADAVAKALAQGASANPAELAAGLADVLKRVGLDDGGRPERALEWAQKAGVGSLASMLLLLQLQAHQWTALLDALAPTKAYHKMRIATQLKRAVGESTPRGSRPARATGGEGVYWSELDNPSASLD